MKKKIGLINLLCFEPSSEKGIFVFRDTLNSIKYGHLFSSWLADGISKVTGNWFIKNNSAPNLC